MKNRTEPKQPIIVDLTNIVDNYYIDILGINGTYVDFKNILNEAFMQYLSENDSSDEKWIIKNFMFVNQVFDSIRYNILEGVKEGNIILNE